MRGNCTKQVSTPVVYAFHIPITVTWQYWICIYGQDSHCVSCHVQTPCLTENHSDWTPAPLKRCIRTVSLLLLNLLQFRGRATWCARNSTYGTAKLFFPEKSSTWGTMAHGEEEVFPLCLFPNLKNLHEAAICSTEGNLQVYQTWMVLILFPLKSTAVLLETQWVFWEGGSFKLNHCDLFSEHYILLQFNLEKLLQDYLGKSNVTKFEIRILTLFLLHLYLIRAYRNICKISVITNSCSSHLPLGFPYLVIPEYVNLHTTEEYLQYRGPKESKIVLAISLTRNALKAEETQLQRPWQSIF